MGRFGNSMVLWLGIQPGDTFFYVFLPPLLLDGAARLDFFVFKKVRIWSLGGPGEGPKVWPDGRTRCVEFGEREPA